jgi:glycosyltransferase involved in cell wall biosynthesis
VKYQPHEQVESVSIISLVYNEAAVIEEVIRSLQAEVCSRLSVSELVVAEDGSWDGTKEILNRLAEEIPMRLISGEQRKGYIQAYRDALGLARHDWIFFTDSGGKHDPEDFWKLYEHAPRYDLIQGYKVNRQDEFYRILLTRVFNRLLNGYFGVSFRDIDCGFRLFSRTLALDLQRQDWIFHDLINSELTLRAVYSGYKVKEVPVSHFARKSGPSRGLPPGKIPGVVLRTLANLPRLKRSLRRTRSGSASK